MDAKLKAEWVKALRSGEFEQGQAQLQYGDKFCCLGVAAIVAGYTIDAKNDSILRPNERSVNREEPSYSALDDFGITKRGPLISMNDSGKPFSEIADYIEANL